MQALDLSDVARYVEDNIGTFHQKRIDSLSRLKLKSVLKRKNPYMFKAKNVQTAEQIVRGILDAHVSSNEETLFGDWLEGLAIFINSKTYGGWKSGIVGVTLSLTMAGVVIWSQLSRGRIGVIALRLGKCVLILKLHNVLCVPVNRGCTLLQ